MLLCEKLKILWTSLMKLTVMFINVREKQTLFMNSPMFKTKKKWQVNIENKYKDNDVEDKRWK